MKYGVRQYVIDYFKTKKTVIPQVRTITRCGTGSVILFNCAESPAENIYRGDSVQTGSRATFLMLFALSYGMTARGINNN